MVLGYPDHLVAALFELLSVNAASRVLDPFCGSGTTLVECMKRGIPSTGIDANPVAVLAATAKTTWNLSPDRLLTIADRVASRAETILSHEVFEDDPTYEYIVHSGMLKRGWISRKPLEKALAIKRALIVDTATTRYKRLLQLCLLSEIVYRAANVKFGPEIYCSKKKRDVALFRAFRRRVRDVAADLEIVRSLGATRTTVLEGDARATSQLLKGRRFTHCICSPPYPTEHDYTRNARLELAFIERVTDQHSLRVIKQSMIRSHTKNIYKGDRDSEGVEEHVAIARVVSRLRRAVGDVHGFVGLYPDVIAHYFGGMQKHFRDLKRVLTPGARCAYVVGDQSSYCGIHIPTAKFLAAIVGSLGFRNIEIVHWRGRWSSTRSASVDENVLMFSLPGD